ncbi:NisI/SpaI family lantibiotic immunity lipoprotein [Oceanobacillus sp. J11TS1]|uniref:NisI/SpaI family lantibiotic immunity lipoprotein n=1 Tax=Oceanobacillus sp. J11TS1 TaxID=2807191 RepID=UPI001B1E7A34|nr:NisI/SpaI family lantibiotic immunity lipoprotein [Oceanobacillus sp. J11TS1]GIO25217.1 hypothetical protein J11TS1_37980 [Oceanobacillus sp. J11TS1]
MTLTACKKTEEFIDKTIKETKKTAYFIQDCEDEKKTSKTTKELLEEGKINHFVFGGSIYKIEDTVEEKTDYNVIGYIGEQYYINQNNKKWSERELHEPYIYLNPKKEIREKRPMEYGLVYSLESAKKSNRDEIIITLNQQLYKAIKCEN